MRYLNDDWCGLEWSDWLPLHSGRSLAKGLGKGPGIYRVRPEGSDHLAYIGQSGKSLRENLTVLREESSSKRVEPHSKHYASTCIFVYRKVKGIELEVSTCSFKGRDEDRLATECFLLWNYRHEAGSSPTCNLGRFHEGYEVSVTPDKGVKVRKSEVENGGNDSIPALDYGEPLSSEDWMGLRWTQWLPLDKRTVKDIEDEVCFLRIADGSLTELLRVVRTDSLKETLHRLVKERWAKGSVFSIAFRGLDLTPVHIAEITNDLVAGYYMESGKGPGAQFRKK